MKHIKFIKAHKIALFLIAAVAVLSGVYVSGKENPSKYDTTLVKRGDVVQEVSLTGRVSGEREVDLAFESGGRVSKEPRLVGVQVNKGDILVQLDTTELTTLLAQATANRNYEVARLAELKRGARAEDILLSQTKVESAQGALLDAERVVFDKLHGAYTTSDDVIHNVVDQFFKNPRTSYPELTLTLNDAKLTIELATARLTLEGMLKKWSTDVYEWESTRNTSAAITSSDQNLATIKAFLEKLAFAVNSLVAGTSPTQVTIDSWKLAVSNARSNINTTITTSLAASEKYKGAERALLIAKEELSLKQVGPTVEAVRAQEAKIAAVEATLENYSAQIAKMTLRAPIRGVVTTQVAKLGQTVAPNAHIVSLMSEGLFKIEANIPEVDVAKVKVGNEAKVTLDAYGSDTIFKATVSMIDPAETIVEGVSTYKVTLRFIDNDPRIRSGMTANIDISTATQKDVLVVPARAVVTKDGVKSVRVLTVLDNQEIITEKVVTTGLRGSESTIEITNGLGEGERVVTFERK